MNWLEILGWTNDELEDLRFVGYSYLEQGKYDIALKFFKTLVIISEKNDYDLQTLGALYLQIGENEKSLQYLEKALKITPNHGPTLLNKAKALILSNKKNDGLNTAKILEKNKDPLIANQAKALILAYEHI